MVPPRSLSAAPAHNSLPNSAISVSRPNTGSAVSPNSVEFASADPRQRAGGLDHRHLHAEAVRDRGSSSHGHSAPRESCPRRRAGPKPRGRESRSTLRGRAPGPRARTPRPRSFEVHFHRWLCRRGQRLDPRFVGVLQARCTCRTMAMETSPSGLRTRSRWSASGRDPARRRAPGRNGRAPPVEPGLPVGKRHLVDRGHVPGLDHRGLADVAEQASLRRSSTGMSRSQRQRRMSGWIPMGAQLFTECLGRLGLQLARRRDVG